MKGLRAKWPVIFDDPPRDLSDHDQSLIFAYALGFARLTDTMVRAGEIRHGDVLAVATRWTT